MTLVATVTTPGRLPGAHLGSSACDSLGERGLDTCKRYMKRVRLQSQRAGRASA